MTKEQIKALISTNVVGQGNQIDISNKLSTILDAIIDIIPNFVNEFVPKVALETEEIAMGEATQKYGLSDEVFGNLTEGKIQWLALSNVEGAKRLQVVVREKDKFLLCGSLDGESDMMVSITLTDDGKFDIVVPA